MSSELTIKTNNVPRDLVNSWELTLAEQAKHLPENFDRENDCMYFVRYKGYLTRLDDFTRIEKRSEWRGGFASCVDDDSPLAAWDGIASDSFFSGLLIRFADDCGKLDYDRVIVGFYCS